MDILEAQFRKIGAQIQKVKWPTQGHTAEKWQGWDLNVNHTLTPGSSPYVVVSGTVLTAENKTQRGGGLSSHLSL